MNSVSFTYARGYGVYLYERPYISLINLIEIIVAQKLYNGSYIYRTIAYIFYMVI